MNVIYVIKNLVFVNEIFKTTIRHKLQYNAIVSLLKNHCKQRDNVLVIQHVRLCLI